MATPVDPANDLARALALHQAGRLGQAIQIYSQLIKAAPQSPDALHLLGLALHQIGRPERSPELIRAAISLSPGVQEYHNNLGLVLRGLGRYREALAAFEEAARLQPGHIEANLSIARILSGQGHPFEALKRIEPVGVQVPDWTDYWITRGRAERLLGNSAAALRSLGHAIVLGRDRSEAWLQRGVTLSAREDWGGAEADLRRALCLSPNLHEALSVLGYRELARARLAAADCVFRRALILADRDVSAHMGRAEVAYGRDEAEAAVALAPPALAPPALAARALAGPHANAHYRFRHGIHLLAAGETERGWAEYDHIYQRGDSVQRIGLPPRWQGDDLAGRRILICAEQGVGDELLFTAHMPSLLEAAGEVILECDARVLTLFRRSFPAAFVHPYSRRRSGGSSTPGRSTQVYDWIPRDKAPDVYAEAGLAFAHYHGSVEQADRNAAPWLVPDPARAAVMRVWLDGLPKGLRVGVSWRSMTMTALRAPHYPGLEGMRAILQAGREGAEGVQFVALQYGPGWREELKASGLPVHVVPDLDTTDDIDGVTALVSQLDLIIGPSCTVNWVAAGVGVPMWMLYNHPTFLNFGERRFPGFPGLRGFSKRIDESWQAPVDAVRRALRDFGP